MIEKKHDEILWKLSEITCPQTGWSSITGKEWVNLKQSYFQVVLEPLVIRSDYAEWNAVWVGGQNMHVCFCNHGGGVRSMAGIIWTGPLVTELEKLV